MLERRDQVISSCSSESIRYKTGNQLKYQWDKAKDGEFRNQRLTTDSFEGFRNTKGHDQRHSRVLNKMNVKKKLEKDIQSYRSKERSDEETRFHFNEISSHRENKEFPRLDHCPDAAMVGRGPGSYCSSV